MTHLNLAGYGCSDCRSGRIKTNQIKRLRDEKNKGGKNMSMLSTGIVRPLDKLGRVVLPIELRRSLDLKEGDSLEIFVDGKMIILKKYEPGCIFCDEIENVTKFKGKNICPKCRNEFRK